MTFCARRVRHDARAAARRQPAEADEAPAAQRQACRARRRRRRTCARTRPRRRRSARSTPTSPAFQARYAKARGEAVDWLRKQLKAEGLAERPEGRRPATRRRSSIDKIAKGATQVIAIRKHAKAFLAVLGPDRGGRRRLALHPRPAADALPVGGRAAARQGRVLDRAGRDRRPGPDRARVRRADRRHRRRRARERQGRRRDGHRPGVQGPRPHRRARAAAARDRAQGHVHRPRAGHRRRRRRPTPATRSRSPRPRRTSTPTRSSPSSTPTRATTSSC